jgi:transposase
VIVDALGTRAQSHRWQRSRRHPAEPLAAQVEPGADLADKGYDADSFINALKCAPSKLSSRQNQLTRSNKLRNLVERFFDARKHCRFIATRYHKIARNFLVGLQLGCGLTRLK